MSDKSRPRSDDDDLSRDPTIDPTHVDDSVGALLHPVSTSYDAHSHFGEAAVDASAGPDIGVSTDATSSAAVDAFGPGVLEEGASLPLTAKARREAAIQKKYESSGGDVMLGEVTSAKEGSYRFYPRAAIVYNRRKEKAYLVRNAIFDEWVALGGIGWGTPNCDEEFVGDGDGRSCHFDDGDERKSIYWTLRTGAHEMHGDIRKCYRDLGATMSWLGYPTLGESWYPDGGRHSEFEHGRIYWWDDTGAIALAGVVIQFTGFHCFGETDWDQGSSSDEPYFVFTASTVTNSTASRSAIYSDVDAGEQRTDLVEVFRGDPWGVNIGTITMEHDDGDPNKVRDHIMQVAVDAYQVVASALNLVPGVGPIGSDVLGRALSMLVPDFSQWINDILGWGDDVIGAAVNSLSAREMVLLAATVDPGYFGAIPYKIETPLMSGEGASYKAYFNVVPA